MRFGVDDLGGFGGRCFSWWVRRICHVRNWLRYLYERILDFSTKRREGRGTGNKRLGVRVENDVWGDVWSSSGSWKLEGSVRHVRVWVGMGKLSLVTESADIVRVESLSKAKK